jgi:SSS family solute:Na+ symporter/sodium/pantothenate symporter
MIIGVLTVGGWLLSQQETLAMLPQRIAELAPEKVQPPSLTKCATWISSLLILGIGGSMYPQGIQRIYAAKSTRTLKHSLSVMVFLPLLTVVFAYYMGLLSIPQFPNLDKVESDKVMAMMLGHIAQLGPMLNIAVSILLLAALAAIMSTADSVLLSLSSILVQDFYAKSTSQPVADDRLLRYGKICSWVLVAILVAIALKPGFTLWRLLEIKFEILMQVAPAFILGFYRPNLNARTAIIGITAGSALALTGFFMGGKWFGVHPGTIGCALNFGICLMLSRNGRAQQESSA